jgi:LysR family transcriptional regulator, cyn operon transcriptional activator
MDLKTLRYCEAIAKHGNFTRAAESLHVVQPVLSVAVKRLEEQLGVTLFARQARRVVPTPEGRLLLAHVARVFQELDSLKRELRDTNDLITGDVTIGLPPMFGITFLPPLLSAFHAAYPGITVNAIEGSADEVARLLDNSVLDLARLEQRRVRESWSSVLVGQDEMVLVVSKNHPLAGQKRVNSRALDQLPMAIFDASFLQRELLDRICRKTKAQYRVVMQSNFVLLIARAIADGVAAGTLTRSLAEMDPQLVPIAFNPKQSMRFRLCWRNDRYLSKANKAFVEVAVARSAQNHRVAPRGNLRPSHPPVEGIGATPASPADSEGA